MGKGSPVRGVCRAPKCHIFRPRLIYRAIRPMIKASDGQASDDPSENRLTHRARPLACTTHARSLLVGRNSACGGRAGTGVPQPGAARATVGGPAARAAAEWAAGD